MRFLSGTHQCSAFTLDDRQTPATPPVSCFSHFLQNFLQLCWFFWTQDEFCVLLKASVTAVRFLANTRIKRTLRGSLGHSGTRVYVHLSWAWENTWRNLFSSSSQGLGAKIQQGLWCVSVLFWTKLPQTLLQPARDLSCVNPPCKPFYACCWTLNTPLERVQHHSPDVFGGDHVSCYCHSGELHYSLLAAGVHHRAAVWPLSL